MVSKGASIFKGLKVGRGLRKKREKKECRRRGTRSCVVPCWTPCALSFSTVITPLMFCHKVTPETTGLRDLARRLGYKRLGLHTNSWALTTRSIYSLPLDISSWSLASPNPLWRPSSAVIHRSCSQHYSGFCSLVLVFASYTKTSTWSRPMETFNLALMDLQKEFQANLGSQHRYCCLCADRVYTWRNRKSAHQHRVLTVTTVPYILPARKKKLGVPLSSFTTSRGQIVSFHPSFPSSDLSRAARLSFVNLDGCFN